MSFEELNDHNKRYALLSEQCGRNRSRLLRERFQRRQLLSSWYGEERARTEIAAHTAAPVRIGTVIDKLCENIADGDAAAFIEAENHWKEIVGPQLAALTRPARFFDGVLYVEVKHVLLLRELSASLDIFLARLHQVCHSQTCQRITLVPPGGRSTRF